jgi:superfamily I DNA/RNA helicase
MCHQLEQCVDQPSRAEITVSTVHKAKGLEWSSVGVSRDFEPFVELLDQRLEHNTDEACVAYVAMTRARTSLTLHPDFMDTLKASGQAAAGKRPERVIRDQQRQARYIPPPRRGGAPGVGPRGDRFLR